MNTLKKRAVKKIPLLKIAYESLKEKIVTLEIEPGMKLEEQDLMEMLKMGRTPIREALKMLISEGLIISYGTNATYVKDMTLKSVKDLRQIINSLGTIAFDLANPHDDFSDIIDKLEFSYRMMDKSIQKGDIRQFVKLNTEFHKIMSKIADNAFLDDALEKIYFFETRRIYLIASSVGEKMETKYINYYKDVQKHHRELIDSLGKKDFKRLKEVYKEHMALAQNRLNMYFEGNAE